MNMPIRTALTLCVLAATWWVPSLAVAAEPQTQIAVRAPVPVDYDSCLDHAVKELGMSAKRIEQTRRWRIGPQFLHPSVVNGGSVTVEHVASTAKTTITVTAAWPGAPKEPVLQAELQERLTAMATKMAQLCGVTAPTLTCEVTAPQAAPAPCAQRKGGG